MKLILYILLFVELDFHQHNEYTRLIAATAGTQFVKTQYIYSHNKYILRTL